MNGAGGRSSRFRRLVVDASVRQSTTAVTIRTQTGGQEAEGQIMTSVSPHKNQPSFAGAADTRWIPTTDNRMAGVRGNDLVALRIPRSKVMIASHLDWFAMRLASRFEAFAGCGLSASESSASAAALRPQSGTGKSRFQSS